MQETGCTKACLILLEDLLNKTSDLVEIVIKSANFFAGGLKGGFVALSFLEGWILRGLLLHLLLLHIWLILGFAGSKSVKFSGRIIWFLAQFLFDFFGKGNIFKTCKGMIRARRFYFDKFWHGSCQEIFKLREAQILEVDRKSKLFAQKQWYLSKWNSIKRLQ